MDANRFIHEERRRERLIEESLKENEDREKARKRERDRKRDEMDESVNFFYQLSATVVAISERNERKNRGPDRQCDRSWFKDGYPVWNDELFKKHFRLKRETFEFILTEIHDEIFKEPTRFKPEPTSPDCQLAITLYRLAHGCTFTVLEDLFGESLENCCVIFNKVCRVLVSKMYGQYVKLPETDDEWEMELKGFLENYEFPCIGAWDGFHVFISSAFYIFLFFIFVIYNFIFTIYNIFSNCILYIYIFSITITSTIRIIFFVH